MRAGCSVSVTYSITQQVFQFYYQIRIYIAGYNFEKAFLNYGIA